MKKDNHYFGWGLTAVCVVCAVMLIYDLVFRDSIVMIYTRKLMEILAPILYGMAIAYLLAPIVNWFERVILPRQPGGGEGRAGRLHGTDVGGRVRPVLRPIERPAAGALQEHPPAGGQSDYLLRHH